MILHDLVDPAELTFYVREQPEPAMIGLNRYLPDRPIPNIKAEWTEVLRTNKAASFRAWDASTPIGDRDSATKKEVELLPLGEQRVIGEYDTLTLAAAQMGGNAEELIANEVFADAEQLADRVRIRAELARGDVLTDGKVTITENGLVGIEADFGLPVAHVKTAAASWHTASTDIPADIEAWLDVVEVYGPVGRMVVSKKTARSLMANTDYQNLASVGGVTPSSLSLNQVNAVHEARGYPPVEIYDSRFDNGGTVRALGEDTVLFLPEQPEDLGFTAWGVTAEAIELAGMAEVQEFTMDGAAGLVAVVTKSDDPVARWTKVTGVCLPVITNPYRMLVADVTP